MNVILPLAVFVAAVTTAHAAESKVGAGRDMAGAMLKIINNILSRRAVVVENWTGQPVRLWCASRNDRIRSNGKEYADLKDQQAIGWSFTPNALPVFAGRTEFWCTFCYKSKRRGWTVYYQGWEKDNNGVPKSGLLRWRIIYDSVRWEYQPPKKGWDFKNWTPQGNC